MADKNQKQQIENLKKLAKSADKTERAQTRANTLAQVNQRILEANNNIAELNRLDRTDEADQLRQELNDLSQSLEKNTNLNSVIKRLEEANELTQRSNEAAQRALSKEEEKAARDKDIANRLKPLSDLSASLRSQADQTDTLTSTMKSIENLQGFFGAANNETSRDLVRQFKESQNNLEEAIKNGNANDERFAREQIAAIGEAAESEEKRREAQKALDEQNDALLKTANGVEGLGNKFDDFASNAAGGVGFLATLAGLALLFLDPQKFAELISKVITNITNVFSGIYAVFTGDIEGGLGLIRENLGTFAALLGGLVLFLGGPLLKGLSMVLKVARVVRGFVLLQWAPGMFAALSGMATSFMAMLAPFAPIIAGVAGIVLLVVGIKKGLEMLRDSLGFSSVFDVILLGVAHLKDAFGHIANTVGSIVNFIMGIVEKFSSFLGFEIDIPEIPELSTDNAAKKKVELQQKALDQKVEKETPTFDQALEGDGTFDAALNTSGFDLDSLNSENFDLALEGQSAPSLTSVVQNNSPSNRKTTNTTIVEQPTSPGMSILSGLSFSR